MRVPGLVDDEEDQLRTDPILKMIQRKDYLKRKEIIRRGRLTRGNQGPSV